MSNVKEYRLSLSSEYSSIIEMSMFELAELVLHRFRNDFGVGFGYISVVQEVCIYMMKVRQEKMSPQEALDCVEGFLLYDIDTASTFSMEELLNEIYFIYMKTELMLI